MQFQLETDLFANNCDHDSMMSESFFHLSNLASLSPLHYCLGGKTRGLCQKNLKRCLSDLLTNNVLHNYPQTALTVLPVSD